MASSISVIPACSALSQCLDDVEGLVDARPVVDEQREKSSMQSRLLRRCLQELANLSTGQPDRLGLLGGLASADLVDAGGGCALKPRCRTCRTCSPPRVGGGSWRTRGASRHASAPPWSGPTR